MNESRNISKNQGLCRVLAGTGVADVVPLLEGDVYVVCDRAVLPLAEKIVKESRTQPIIRAVLPLETSEEKKNLDTVMAICRWLLEKGADRGAMLLAIGGGITTDMAGFAASIYKRGIRFAFVPTTLLAQVDAAIGGKTGVNFMDLKNMLGVIRQPEWTWICPEPLRTLPLRDFRGGAAELLKTFLIEDRNDNYARAVRLLTRLCGAGADAACPDTATKGAGSACFDMVAKGAGAACPDTVTKGAGATCFDMVATETDGGQKAERSGARAAGMDPEAERELQDLIAGAATVKADIVGRDPYERGERRKLNLGHTFAHGIESVARKRGYDISHGEAVAIGILIAARLAEKLGLAENSPADPVDAADESPARPGAAADFGKKGLAARLEADFRACGLPTASPFPLKTLAGAMTKDKKAEGGVVRFILPVAVGTVVERALTVRVALDLLGKGTACPDSPRDDASRDPRDTGATDKEI